MPNTPTPLLTPAEVREMLDWCLDRFPDDGLDRFRGWLDLREGLSQ